LPYVGEGNNLLPTIHVTDLARMVKAIYEKKPARKYIFAIDSNKDTKKLNNTNILGLLDSADANDKQLYNIGNDEIKENVLLSLYI
jgi:dTDP-D-glucose 4,6-dehydratase